MFSVFFTNAFKCCVFFPSLRLSFRCSTVMHRVAKILWPIWPSPQCKWPSTAPGAPSKPATIRYVLTFEKGSNPLDIVLRLSYIWFLCQLSSNFFKFSYQVWCLSWLLCSVCSFSLIFDFPHISGFTVCSELACICSFTGNSLSNYILMWIIKV